MLILSCGKRNSPTQNPRGLQAAWSQEGPVQIIRLVFLSSVR